MYKDVLIVSSIDFSLQQLKMLDLVKLYFLSAEEQPLPPILYSSNLALKSEKNEDYKVAYKV